MWVRIQRRCGAYAGVLEAEMFRADLFGQWGRTAPLGLVRIIDVVNEASRCSPDVNLVCTVSESCMLTRTVCLGSEVRYGVLA
jgi:hypothetical protein